MGDPVPARPDHVAIAVPDFATADARWRDQLGGRPVAWADNPTFRSRQYRFRGGAKVELLQPAAEDRRPSNFVRRFLERFGAVVHHVTLKVPELRPAIETVEAAGYDVVDVDERGEVWREAFLRPSQVGGLVVQLGWMRDSDEDIARWRGMTLEEPPPDAVELVGPLLRHPDPDAAAHLWAVLGAEVARDGDRLTCVWEGHPLRILVERGEPAGPVAVLVRGGADLPADPRRGGPVRELT